MPRPKGLMTNFRGKNFVIESRCKIEFFGVRGLLRNGKIYRGSSEKDWSINQFELFEKYDAKKEVLKLIEEDVKAGKGDLVHDILLKPSVGVVFFFNAKLVYRMHLLKEVDEEIHIPGVLLNDREYEIVISPNAQADIATRDVYGEIIE